MQTTGAGFAKLLWQESSVCYQLDYDVVYLIKSYKRDLITLIIMYVLAIATRCLQL